MSLLSLDDSQITKSSLLGVMTCEDPNILQEAIGEIPDEATDLMIKKLSFILVRTKAGLLRPEAVKIVSDPQFISGILSGVVDVERLKVLLKIAIDNRVVKTDENLLSVNALPYDRLKQLYLELKSKCPYADYEPPSKSEMLDLFTYKGDDNFIDLVGHYFYNIETGMIMKCDIVNPNLNYYYFDPTAKDEEFEPLDKFSCEAGSFFVSFVLKMTEYDRKHRNDPGFKFSDESIDMQIKYDQQMKHHLIKHLKRNFDWVDPLSESRLSIEQENERNKECELEALRFAEEMKSYTNSPDMSPQNSHRNSIVTSFLSSKSEMLKSFTFLPNGEYHEDGYYQITPINRKFYNIESHSISECKEIDPNLNYYCLDPTAKDENFGPLDYFPFKSGSFLVSFDLKMTEYDREHRNDPGFNLSDESMDLDKDYTVKIEDQLIKQLKDEFDWVDPLADSRMTNEEKNLDRYNRDIINYEDNLRRYQVLKSAYDEALIKFNQDLAIYNADVAAGSDDYRIPPYMTILEPYPPHHPHL